jgi:nucleotide-binding universal stress UspA family protein
MTVKKVLIPVDGSPSSLRALKFAARKYSRSGSTTLLVLTVQERLPASRRVPRAMIAEHQSRLAEAALKPAREVLKDFDVDVDCYSRIGDPATTIVSFATRTRCSEIVMGTRGRGRVSGLVMGSVAMKVVHLSKIPVMLVK